MQAKHEQIEREEVRVESEFTEDAELVVVAFGSLARFVRYVVRALRQEGVAVGYVRPITLWPFPSEVVAKAAETARCVAVMEQNAGQMIDDVRLAVLGRAPVVPIGGISTDPSGFGIGGMLNPESVRNRIEGALSIQETLA